MKTNHSKSGGIEIQVAAVVIAVVAVVASVVAIQQARSVKQSSDEIQSRVGKLESESTSAAQLADEVSRMKSQIQNDYDKLSMDIAAVKDQMTKKPEPSAAKSDVKGENAPTGPGTFHKVKSGDYFEKIAKKYGTSVDAIEKLNPGVDSAKLRIGQNVRVQ